jgi:hypothetical protein
MIEKMVHFLNFHILYPVHTGLSYPNPIFLCFFAICHTSVESMAPSSSFLSFASGKGTGITSLSSSVDETTKKKKH